MKPIQDFLQWMEMSNPFPKMLEVKTQLGRYYYNNIFIHLQYNKTYIFLL